MIPAQSVARSALPRAARQLRIPRRQQIRFQSQSTASSSSAASSGTGSSFATGIAGGLVGAGIFYGAYSFTPAGKAANELNKIAKDAEQKYQAAAKKLQQATPSPDEAVDYIREFAYSYVRWIPGGRAYVDKVFDDWETVREKHREEADALVNDAYKQFQQVSRSGLSLETASKAYEALADLSKKLADLAGVALFDMLDNHPQVKEKLGGNVDTLKKLGEQYGPEAKKQVDETWKQVEDIISGGLSVSNIDKARKLIEEKAQQIQKLGDEAWKKGLKQAKPYLDKNPKIKELIENNADALKKGNAKEIFDKVKSAAESGDLGDLEKTVNNAVEHAKSKGPDALGGWGDLEKYFKMIPQGDEILPKLQQLAQVADKQKDEGEKLLKETLEELKQVLEKKSEKAGDIAEKAKKEAK